MEITRLRAKDERDDWEKISYKDIVKCQSSLHFFDEKGMRFCLPKFLIADLLYDEIATKQGIYAPDPLFTLTHNICSLFNEYQVQAVIHYLEYKLVYIKQQCKKYWADRGVQKLHDDIDYINIINALTHWKKRYLDIKGLNDFRLYEKFK